MWRIHEVARCSHCGALRTSSEKVYKWDDDEYHAEALAGSPDMKRVLKELYEMPCPKCGKTGAGHHGWSDAPIA